MLYSKLEPYREQLYKNSDKIIIGESAGAVVLFDRYFLTKENNFYKTMEFYDGLRLIKNNFYIDVHTRDNEDYQNELNFIYNKIGRPIYEIYNNGSIVIENNQVMRTFGTVECIDRSRLKE